MFVLRSRRSRALLLALAVGLVAASAQAGGYLEVPSLIDPETRDVLRVDLESVRLDIADSRTSGGGDGEGAVTFALRSSGAAAELLRAALEEGGIDEIEVWLPAADVAGGQNETPKCYLKYKLGPSFIKSWSMADSSAGTEQVAFYYNKLALAYRPTADGRTMY